MLGPNSLVYSGRKDHYCAPVKYNFKLEAKLLDNLEYFCLMRDVCSEDNGPDFNRNIRIFNGVDKSIGQGFAQQGRFSSSRVIHQRAVLSDDKAEHFDEWADREEIIEPPASS